MALRNRRLAQLGLVALFVLLATLHTWPMPTDPAHLTRLDNNDTAYNTWVVAWVAHALATDPLHLFDAPIFHPAPDALAFSEHMLVQGMLGAPLQWAGVSPVAVYNALIWLGLTLSGSAMAWLIRGWTGSTLAGIVSGCLYAFNAHLLTRYAHLQALHIQFFPVVLFAFDRVLRGGGPRVAALLAGMFVLQALCSNYTMVLMAAALVLSFVVRPEPWHARPMRLWITLAITGLAVLLLLLPFLLPYYRVRAEQGLVRTIDDVRMYSAGWRDYLATGGRLHYQWWSHAFFVEGRTALFPGVVALGLTALAVVSGVAWKDTRARMALAFGVGGFILSFGAAVPGYEWLQDHVPLLQGIRAVARWGVLFLIAVAILAGFAVAAIESRLKHYRAWAPLAVALVGVITAESLRAPLSMQHFEGLSPVHRALAHDDVEAIVVFPLYGGADFHLNARYMLDQTQHWRPMLNAYSSWAPPDFYRRAERLQTFPDPAAIQELRATGFSHVVLHRVPLEQAFGKAAVDALRTHADLQFVIEDDGVIIYKLR